jgi:hypothetical protein
MDKVCKHDGAKSKNLAILETRCGQCREVLDRPVMLSDLIHFTKQIEKWAKPMVTLK